MQRKYSSLFSIVWITYINWLTVISNASLISVVAINFLAANPPCPENTSLSTVSSSFAPIPRPLSHILNELPRYSYMVMGTHAWDMGHTKMVASIIKSGGIVKNFDLKVLLERCSWFNRGGGDKLQKFCSHLSYICFINFWWFFLGIKFTIVIIISIPNIMFLS